MSKGLKICNKREAALAFIAILVVAFLGMRAYIASRPPVPLTTVADRYFAVLLDGGRDDLYRYLEPDERELMTRDQFDSLVKWAAGCFEGLRTSGERVDRDRMQGYALASSQDLVGPEGFQMTARGYFSRTPDGAAFSSLQIFKDAISAKYFPRSRLPIEERWPLALRAAMAKEGATLARLSPRSFFIERRPASWHDIVVRAEVMLESARLRRKDPMARIDLETLRSKVSARQGVQPGGVSIEAP